MYNFTYDGDEAGIWKGDVLIASLSELGFWGYSIDYLLGLSPRALNKLGRKLES